MKSKLLVSVRDENEARLVSRYEIGIVDAKEPSAGSLGKLPDPVLRGLLEVVSPGQFLSLALGEIDTLNHHKWDPALLARFHYAKIGMAGAMDLRDWRADLSRSMSQLPEVVARVAVAYVDYQRCRAPAIGQIVAAGAQLGCAAVLLDTCGKSAGDLFTHVNKNQLKRIVNQIQSNGMRAVVAGSISVRSLAAVLDCEPDFVGIRGAVCEGERTTTIGEAQLSHFVNLFRDLLETKFPKRHSTQGSHD